MFFASVNLTIIVFTSDPAPLYVVHGCVPIQSSPCIPKWIHCTDWWRRRCLRSRWRTRYLEIESTCYLKYAAFDVLLPKSDPPHPTYTEMFGFNPHTPENSVVQWYSIEAQINPCSSSPPSESDLFCCPTVMTRWKPSFLVSWSTSEFPSFLFQV